MKYLFIDSFLILAILFFSACKETIVRDSMNGVYMAYTPNGEFILVATETGDDYCVVCKNNTVDSIRITYEGNIIKDTAGNTIAKLYDKDGIISASIPTTTDEMITTEFTHHDFVSASKAVTIKHPIRYLEPITDDSAQVHTDYYSTEDGFYSSNLVGDIPISEIGTYVDNMLKEYNLWTKKIDLYMDVYSLENDTVSRRPLVILLHGGAFLYGDKGGTFMRHLAQHYATRGYVVASVNYRLGCSMTGISTIQRTIYRSVQDALKATHFLIDRAGKYRIDPNAIFFVGHSAGAVTALSAAVLTEEDQYKGIHQLFAKPLGELPSPVKLLGTVGLWGAITDLDYIDNEDNPDFLLMHGTNDNIVPFREGIPFLDNSVLAKLFFNFSLYGSNSIKDKMDGMNLPCELYLFPGMNHDPHLDVNGKFNDNINIVDSVTTSFLYRKLDKLCPSMNVTQDVNYSKRYRIKHDDNIRNIVWNVEGGLIFKKPSDNEIECYMFSNALSSKVTATVTLMNQHIVTLEAK